MIYRKKNHIRVKHYRIKQHLLAAIMLNYPIPYYEVISWEQL
jgi:hypothetical protein